MYRFTPFLKLITLLCVFVVSQVQAQDATPVKPDNYTGPVNYVRTWEASAPITDPNVLTSRPLKDVKMTTQYVDGLGRPVETVLRQGSLATGNLPVDLVNAQTYDEFGREIRTYLPFASNTNNGSFKLDPWDQQANFYGNSFTSPIKGQGETFFYSKTEFESSPLNRVDRSYAAGNSWVHDGNGEQAKYWTNTDLDQVRIWNVQDVLGDWGTYSTPTTSGVYAAGTLYKNISEDEKGKQVIEFTDKEGEVILKKVQLLDNVNGNAVKDDGTGRDYTGWLCTYYIYDDLGQIRCVIQPKAVEELAKSTTNWTLTTGLLDELCFRYEYDARGRMTMKKVPGAAPLYMVYDTRDRLVMAQDGNLRPLGKWIVTKYDDLNRSVETGFWTDNTAFTTHLSSAYNSINYPNPTGNYDLLTETHYDNYNGLPSGLQSSFIASGYSAYLNAGSSENADGFPSSSSSLTKGIVTWTREKVVGTTNQFLSTVNLYDDKGRLVQTQSINITGGLDVATTQYNFSGQVVRNHVSQVNGSHSALEVATKKSYDDLGRLSLLEKAVGSNAAYKPLSALSYNELGQLKTKKLAPSFDNSAGLETLTYDYNIRGWALGVNRDYLATEGQTTDGRKFGFELGYDKTTNKAGQAFTRSAYDGNITGMLWKSDGDDIRRKYDFIYDNANRLLQANFTQQNAEDHLWNNNKVDYTVKMGDGTLDPTKAYDVNGNILGMQQWGLKLTGSTWIDNLTYHYYKGELSNKLMTVSDDKGSGLGDFDDKNPSGNDYGYDANGNMVTDQNKGVKIPGVTVDEAMTSGGAITYNHLNLPETIAVKGDNNTDKGLISYTYDAGGDKLQKKVVEYNVSTTYNNQQYVGDVTTTTTYLGDAVYETKSYQKSELSSLGYTDKLQFMSHEEGRLRYVPADNGKPAHYEYDYFLKDHLGNVRMVLTEQKDDHVYVATMEAGARAQENQLFSNLDASQYPASTAGFPGGGAVDPNETVARVNGNSQTKGPGLVLKVMAGDVVDVAVRSLYHNNPGTQPTVDLFNDILASLAGGIVSSSGVAKGTLADLSDPVNSPLKGALTGFRQDNNNDLPSKPKAYLNWVLVDEQFKYVNTFPQSGAMPVGAAETVTPLGQSGINITKNGYLYIYASNETQNWDVFFDDLAVTHHTGPLLEETHYYPFGLTMAGISSKAVKGSDYAENKRKFNGIELVNELGIDIYDAQLRELDPQLGRWWQIDPKVEGYESVSPYSAMNDAPIRYSDPLGDEADEASGCCLGLKKAFASVSGAVIGTIDNNVPGSNLRGLVASSGIIEDAEVADSWNKALDVADQAGIVQGVGEGTAGGGLVSASVTVTTGSGGLTAEVTVPSAAVGAGMVLHGTFVATKSAGNLTSQNGRVNVNKSNSSSGGSQNTSKAQQKANKLSEKQRPGQDFTRAGKKAVNNLNKEQNGGVMKCKKCGVEVVNPKQHKKGVTPPSNEAHVDHIDPKSKNGSGTPNNGQTLCRQCNLEKSNN